MQERDNESEAELKPPDSSSLGVIRIKGLRCGMSKRNEGALGHKSSGSGAERGRDTYDNTNPGITNETLEWPSQSCLFLLS
jgi:hypothetical protein